MQFTAPATIPTTTHSARPPHPSPNDRLHAVVTANQKRFAAFAAWPNSDPKAVENFERLEHEYALKSTIDVGGAAHIAMRVLDP
jgi:predicted TIM-barrel fold metal-dependent hydrolase